MAHTTFLRDDIALLQGIIAWRYCGALLRDDIAGHYCWALLQGRALLRGIIALAAHGGCTSTMKIFFE
jgi:hypothetical protein